MSTRSGLVYRAGVSTAQLDAIRPELRYQCLYCKRRFMDVAMMGPHEKVCDARPTIVRLWAYRRRQYAARHEEARHGR